MREKTPLILNIETAASVCSVALTKGNIVLNYMESLIPNAHSKMLQVLIERIFESTYYSIDEISAVAVSKGPGSYTGLRIGVSSAKAIAYAKDIPLISIDTLKILAFSARKKYRGCYFLPMIDARRMEVYTCLYDENLNTLRDIQADIVEADIYKNYPYEKIILVGDGATKCKQILTDKRYVLDGTVYLSAKDMAQLSYDKFLENDFEDTAYFEPYYLKEFIAVKSKVKGLYNN